MMREVVMMSRAEKELYEAALWWSEHRSTEQAIHWLEGFEAAIKNLGDNAEQHPFVPEAGSFTREYRQIVYGIGRRKTHRAVFEICGGKVSVRAIRHLAQEELRPGDL